MVEKINKASFGSPDRPLKIGGMELACYVLEDGKRVLVKGGMMTAIGMKIGGGRTQEIQGHAQGGDKLTQFVQSKALKPYISTEVSLRIENPIQFKLPNGRVAYGYEATLLPDICNAVLESREAGALSPKQKHIAKQCEILVRGLAVVGIIALVDEATGYQEIRDREALQQILDKYITDEWAKWTKTFPDEFYKQVFRLKSMVYPPANGRKPSYIGHWTNDIVYSRIAPGIVQKLKEVDPRLPSGNRARKFHQHMTEDYGSPELRRHLDNLIFLMKGCTTWSDFYRKLARSAPKHGDTLQFDFPAKEDEGDE